MNHESMPMSPKPNSNRPDTSAKAEVSLWSGKSPSKIVSKVYRWVLVFMDNIFKGNETNFNDK